MGLYSAHYPLPREPLNPYVLNHMITEAECKQSWFTLVVGYTGVMFQMQYIQVSFKAACFSEHFDTSFKKIGLKMTLRRLKNYFGVGAKSGVLRKMVK